MLALAIFFSARASEAKPCRPEAAIEAVETWLTIHRGAGPDGQGGRLPLHGAVVEGVATYRLVAPAKPGEVLHLLDFTGFMREDPLQLDEVTIGGYLSGPFDPGHLEITGFWGTETPLREGPREDLVLRLHPGVTEVTLRYRIKVPHRYWPFGCVRDRCSLSGAIAPLPSAPAEGGRLLPSGGRVVVPVAWWIREAEFSIPGERRPDAAGPGTLDKIRPDEIVIAGSPGERIAYPSVFWGPRWHRVKRFFQGVEVEVLHDRVRPSSQVPDEVFVQPRRDIPGHVLRIADELLALLAHANLVPQPGSKLTIVQGPLRSAVAEAHPDVAIVSDQAMQLLPLARLLKFHEDAMARAIADALLEHEMRGRHSPSTDLWLTGQMAFALLERWRALRSQPDEFAADILRRLTFIPAVDRFLYTKQAAFSSAYFRGVEDNPPLRFHPLWFAHELPTGRRIHEKLSDTLSNEETVELYDELFAHPDVDPKAAAEQAYGFSLDWFFDQWLGPYPSVDYAIESVRSTPAADGYDHAIVIARHAPGPLIEPVQVLVTERRGQQHFLVWNGELEPGEPATGQPGTGRHTFALHTKRRIEHVRIDPRHRLVQVPQPPKDNVDPEFNDRRPAAFRFLYTGISLNIAASELFGANTLADSLNAISGFASFESSLRRDLRMNGDVLIARDRESDLAVGIGVHRWFGRKVNLQRRRARITLSTTTAWLSDESLDPRGGVRISERLSISDDTRRFGWWPEQGRRLWFSLVSSQTIRTEGERDHRYTISVDGGWTHLWRVAHDHVIATSTTAGILFPIRSEPEFRGLLRVGGIGGLSGYLADEVFGLAKADAQVEYRHVFLRNMRLNLLHLVFLRAIGGVAFVGAASISPCDGYRGWFGERSYHAHAGYGLTARFSVLGVSLQLLRVEIAVPLVRYRNVQCLDQTFPDFLATRQGLDDATQLLRPFNINVLFGNAF